MNGEFLAVLFSLNHHVIQVNTDGLTHEESLLQPRPAGNCINWVLGHILANRNSAMKLVEAPPIWDEARAARYVRGSRPLVDPNEAVPLAKILADLNRSQEALLGALVLTPDERFAEASDGRTLAEKVAMYHFHEAYHAGQLGLLRRLTGKEGAIR